MSVTKKILEEVEGWKSSGNAPLEKTFGRDPDAGKTLIIEFLSDLQAVAEEIEISQISGSSKKKHRKKIDQISKNFLSAIRERDSQSFCRQFNLSQVQEYFLLLSDLIEVSGGIAYREAESDAREKIRKSTRAIFKVIEESQFDDVFKKTILMNIALIERMCDYTALYSDDQIRARVKQLMADMFFEWETLKKQDESTLSKLNKWGKETLSAGRHLLGFAADAGGVAGLIPPP